MMSRSFTTREKILLLVLCVLLLGIVYYWFVVRDVDKTIEKYNTDDLELELTIEQTKALSMKQMTEEMSGKTAQDTGIVASYNNIKNEINELNDIFASASSYHFEFGQAMKDSDAVRRDIDISFTASSYSTAKEIITQLHNCKYRCLIRNVDISMGAKTGGVSVTLTATFFETMYNADTTDGLETETDEKNPEGQTE